MEKKEKHFLQTHITRINEREAIDWYRYLKGHKNSEEVESLYREILERYVNEFENQLSEGSYDAKRVRFMRKYLDEVYGILNK